MGKLSYKQLFTITILFFLILNIHAGNFTAFSLSNQIDRPEASIAHDGNIYIFSSTCGAVGFYEFLNYDTRGVLLYKTKIASRVIAVDINNTSIFGVGWTDQIPLMKFDLQGNLIWAKPWYIGSQASAIKIDGAYIYVVGKSDDGAGIIKYDHQGGMVWNRNFSSATGSLVHVDKNHAVLMGGDYQEFGKYKCPFIAKYDSDGNLLWSEIWNTTSTHSCSGIAIDDSDNVYIAGYFTYTSYDRRGFILKYNSSGDFQWNLTIRYAGISNDIQGIVGIQNNFYVTVTSFGYSDVTYLLKYNSAGTLLWNLSWTDRHAWHLTTDGYFIYLSGDFSLFPERDTYFSDIFLTKCTADGIELWTQFYASEEPNIILISVLFGGIGVTAALLFYKDWKYHYPKKE